MPEGEPEQKEQKTVDARKLEEVRCPYCNGTCELNAAHTEATCQYCGRKFEIVRKNEADKAAWEGVQAIQYAKKLIFEGADMVYAPKMEDYARKAKDRLPESADALYLEAAVILLKTQKMTHTVKNDVAEARRIGGAEYFTEDDYAAVLKYVADHIKTDNKMMIYTVGGFGFFWGVMLISIGVFLLDDIGAVIMIGFGIVWMVVLLAVSLTVRSKVPHYDGPKTERDD
ncbi:MAG: hypothetical protein ACOX8X_01065 [Methanomethylophilus sp.]|jgi:uncharacterized Zn-finger protein